MAANLGFKGPLQRQVMGTLKVLKSQCKERGERSIMRTHTQSGIYSHSQTDQTLAIISFPEASYEVSLH